MLRTNLALAVALLLSTSALATDLRSYSFSVDVETNKSTPTLCCQPGGIVEATTGDSGHGYGKCVERRRAQRRKK